MHNLPPVTDLLSDYVIFMIQFYVPGNQIKPVSV